MASPIVLESGKNLNGSVLYLILTILATVIFWPVLKDIQFFPLRGLVAVESIQKPLANLV